MNTSHVVSQTMHAANKRGGPRLSMSKRRSSSVGYKARLAACHPSASVPVPVSSSTSLSSTLALNHSVTTTSVTQHADKVLLTAFNLSTRFHLFYLPVIKQTCLQADIMRMLFSMQRPALSSLKCMVIMYSWCIRLSLLLSFMVSRFCLINCFTNLYHIMDVYKIYILPLERQLDAIFTVQCNRLPTECDGASHRLAVM